jgi:hypothetical protein
MSTPRKEHRPSCRSIVAWVSLPNGLPTTRVVGFGVYAIVLCVICANDSKGKISHKHWLTAQHSWRVTNQWPKRSRSPDITAVTVELAYAARGAIARSARLGPIRVRDNDCRALKTLAATTDKSAVAEAYCLSSSPIAGIALVVTRFARAHSHAAGSQQEVLAISAPFDRRVNSESQIGIASS